MSNIYFFYLPYIYVFAWKTKLITNTKSVGGKFKKKKKKQQGHHGHQIPIQKLG